MKSSKSFSTNRVRITISIKEKVKGDMELLNFAVVAGFINDPVNMQRYSHHGRWEKTKVELRWCFSNVNFSTLEYEDICSAIKKLEEYRFGKLGFETPLCWVIDNKETEGDWYQKQFSYGGNEEEDEEEEIPYFYEVEDGDILLRTKKAKEVTYLQDVTVQQVGGEIYTIMLLQKKRFPIAEMEDFVFPMDHHEVLSEFIEGFNKRSQNYKPDWDDINDVLVIKGDIRDFYAKLTNEHLAKKLEEVPLEFQPLREAIQAQMIGNG